MFKRYGYGTTVWSPLAGGLMTGKYNDGNLPPGSRFDSDPFTKAFAAMYYGADKEKMTENRNEVGKIAEELGCTQAQLALAWVIVN